MPPLDDIAKPGSKTLDRALSLVAALIVVAIIIVARYWSHCLQNRMTEKRRWSAHILWNWAILTTESEPSWSRMIYHRPVLGNFRWLRVWWRSRLIEGSIVPQTDRMPTFERLYSIEELVELQRNTLRYARSFPPGAERNQHRQVAMSLRGLFKNKTWLDAHTVEASE
jgi:hypothetical protein